jgi:16S rRNA (guanine(966)-N(2))-methyltransferase RsmD
MGRIISGKLKSLRLEIIANAKMRPTTDRVKESLFNILQFRIQKSVFLDIFSGTGQIGIEAASRGAKHVTMVEKNESSIKIIKKNLSKYIDSCQICEENIEVNFSNKLKFRREDVFSLCNLDALDFLENFKNKEKFDIIFADPPFSSEFASKYLYKLANVVNFDGVIIIETLYNFIPPCRIYDFSLIKRYKYGRISLNLYKIEN